MRRLSFCLVVFAVIGGCSEPGSQVEELSEGPALEVFAESDRQWTGVAVTEDGRVFVNFPRWSPEVPVSVAEVLPNGDLIPFPDEAWNAWVEDGDPEKTFVCVQSVVADDHGSLWILDPANPWFRGVMPGTAKLVEIDPVTGEVGTVITFDEDVAPRFSYLNDVRIDNEREAAYITDSGMGALVVVDLATGSSRRVLDDHPSTSSEDTVLTFDGSEWLLPAGSRPQVHADGIAYDRNSDFVYYQALTGRSLYRIAGSALRDEALDADELAAKVETVAVSGPSDGLLWDGVDGIFISAIEDDAVKHWSPGVGVETVIADPSIAWPDSFAHGPHGALYITTSQIHRGPNPSEPYRVLRVTDF